MKYQGWSLESYSFEVIFSDDAIELDQQEEEVDHWKIVPLIPPPKVIIYRNNTHTIVFTLYIAY